MLPLHHSIYFHFSATSSPFQVKSQVGLLSQDSYPSRKPKQFSSLISYPVLSLQHSKTNTTSPPHNLRQRGQLPLRVLKSPTTHQFRKLPFTSFPVLSLFSSRRRRAEVVLTILPPSPKHCFVCPGSSGLCCFSGCD